MQLVIAEKPSVGMALAKALGVTEKKDGYVLGTDHIVSWCVGHLVGLANADVYDEKFKKWNIDDLPISPNSWEFVVSEDKNEQFNVLKQLMEDSRVTEVVNACDAGREGELIFRLVYNKAGCTKPIKRLWISSMEETAIVDGFRNLKDGREYENLYQSALCRAKADWLVGINSTRVFSKLYNRTLNVGRVMTPTLAMLSERENAISSFVKEKYFNVHIKDDGIEAVYEKVKEQNEAEKIKAECNGKKAVVKSVKRERKTVNPPKLYDLTTLQREANRLYGFTAQQTLDYAQSLYESKLITYPRTDSQYLTEDMANTASEITMKSCAKLPHFSGMTITPDVKPCLNNKKVTDHTAIIPTASFDSTDLEAVPDGEKKILFLIVCRLLCSTSEKYIYETVTAEISCGGYSFIAKGKSVVSLGWKEIEQRFRAYQKCNDEAEAAATEETEEAVISVNEEMPDKTVSIEDMNAYGYGYDGMLPLDTERALELFDEGRVSVYLLYEDGTEGMATDRSDIENHTGYFGVEVPEWNQYLAYAEHRAELKATEPSKEALLLGGKDDTVAIYQLTDTPENRDMIPLQRQDLTKYPKGYKIYTSERHCKVKMEK